MKDLHTPHRSGVFFDCSQHSARLARRLSGFLPWEESTNMTEVTKLKHLLRNYKNRSDVLQPTVGNLFWQKWWTWWPSGTPFQPLRFCDFAKALLSTFCSQISPYLSMEIRKQPLSSLLMDSITTSKSNIWSLYSFPRMTANKKMKPSKWQKMLMSIFWRQCLIQHKEGNVSRIGEKVFWKGVSI